MINQDSAEWTDQEKLIAVSVLNKIVFCQLKRVLLPSVVYEAHLAGKKNVTTELLLIKDGKLFLVKRPSRKENPNEPYPDLWHSTGVTHLSTELESEALKRLSESEGVIFQGVRSLAYAEIHDPPRAKYLAHIMIADLIKYSNPRGRLFSREEIPWHDMIGSHRNVLVPQVVDFLK
nr:hypothetical protein [uncultured bacterium]